MGEQETTALNLRYVKLRGKVRCKIALCNRSLGTERFRGHAFEVRMRPLSQIQQIFETEQRISAVSESLEFEFMVIVLINKWHSPELQSDY